MLIATVSSPRIEHVTNKRGFFVTDVDNTLIGDHVSLNRFIEAWNGVRDRIRFGVATGRSVRSAMRVLQECDVPLPDILITSVGSEIYYLYSGGPVADLEWTKYIDYGWSRDSIVDAISCFSELETQPHECQGTHKISYFISEDAQVRRQEIQEIIGGKGLSANVIVSHNRYVDILPVRASKGLAVNFLVNKWGVDPNEVLTSGDSGNDETMLRGPGRAIVVGNYSSEIEALRDCKNIYFAKSSFAAGILEGIEHFQFLKSTISRFTDSASS